MTAKIYTSILIFFLLASIFLLLGVAYLLGKTTQEHKNKQLKIAMDPSWYPENLIGKSGLFTALCNRLSHRLADKMGLLLDTVSLTPSGLSDALAGDDVDAFFTTIQLEANRADQFYQSRIFYPLGFVIIVVRDSTIIKKQDLAKKRVGVVSASASEFTDDLPNSVILHGYETTLMAIDGLINGELDAVLSPRLYAYLLVEGLYRDQLKVVPIFISKEGFRLIAKRTDKSKKIIDAFHNILDDEKAYHTLIHSLGLVYPF